MLCPGNLTRFWRPQGDVPHDHTLRTDGVKVQELRKPLLKKEALFNGLVGLLAKSPYYSGVGYSVDFFPSLLRRVCRLSG